MSHQPGLPAGLGTISRPGRRWEGLGRLGSWENWAPRRNVLGEMSWEKCPGRIRLLGGTRLLGEMSWENWAPRKGVRLRDVHSGPGGSIRAHIVLVVASVNTVSDSKCPGMV